MNTYTFDNTTDATKAMNLAIGRIFRLGSRPFQEGDIELYEEAKRVCLHAAEFLGLILPQDLRPNYAKDYKRIYHD
jgi:hypothetical protein